MEVKRQRYFDKQKEQLGTVQIKKTEEMMSKQKEEQLKKQKEKEMRKKREQELED